MLGQAACIVHGVFALRNVGPVFHFELLHPAVGELLHGQSDRAAESRFDAACALDPVEDLADLLLAVFVGDVVPQRLAAAVGEVPVELLHGGQILVHRGVADEHVRVGVPFQRLVFRQPFVEPDRKLEGDVVADDRLDAAAVKHVVEHGMHELVMDHVAEFLVVSFIRDNDPVLEKLCDAADAFFHVFADDIRLLEGIVRIVHDNGDTVDELVLEQLAYLHIRRLGGVRRKLRQRIAVVGEIHVEMIGLNIGPVEFCVLDLVLPELILLGCQRRRHDGTQCRTGQNRPKHKLPFHTVLSHSVPSITTHA